MITAFAIIGLVLVIYYFECLLAKFDSIRISSAINGVIIFGLIVALVSRQPITVEKSGDTPVFSEQIEEPEIPEFLTAPVNDSLFLEACYYYGVRDPKYVLAQAHIESGHFKSDVFKRKNNCLGLYDSKKKEYFSFDHWSDCVKGYVTSVEYKRRENESHVAFLSRIGYAEDPKYISKVKAMYKKL